jgi:hypothetical protein
MNWSFFNIAGLTRTVDNAVQKGIEDTLSAIHNQALQEVPHDTGFLSQSIFTKAEGLEGFISAGGGAGTGFPRVPYAIKWHEVPANFQKGRKNNYVRDPLNGVGVRTLKPNIERRISQAL